MLALITACRSVSYIHRDMKPSNLLLNSECHLKLADFVLARSLSTPKNDDPPLQVLTDYVATRWYRAPEILLGSTCYTKGVDMWSIGCILAELLGGRPLLPGDSTTNQIEKILEVTGTPTQEEIESIKSEFANQILGEINVPQKLRTFDTLYPNADKDAINLLENLLNFNPDKRMTAEEALNHPYVAQFHSPDEEIVCTKSIHVPIDDNKKYSVSAYRDELYNSIIRPNVEVKKASRGSSETKKSKRGSGSGKKKVQV